MNTMKRFLPACLLTVCLILLSVCAFSPRASAAAKYTDLSQLDSSASYTYEDMLAIYELGYSTGYQDGRADSGAAQLTRASAAAASDSSTGYNYVLNTKTGKFHYPDCSSVDDMNEKNKSYFSGTRDEAIAQGYQPCGRCKP